MVLIAATAAHAAWSSPASRAIGAPTCVTSPVPPFPPQVPVATSDLAAPSLPPSIDAARSPDGGWQVELSYRPPAPVDSVTVAGDFNRWNATSNPMQRGPDGVWRARLGVDGTCLLYTSDAADE